jgi:hypothetical protein
MVNSPYVPPNHLLPLSVGWEILLWGQYEVAMIVLLKYNVFQFLFMDRNLCFVVQIQFLNTKLPHSPAFEIFIGAIPPVVARISKRIPN